MQARIAKQPDRKLWSICDQRWDVLTTNWRSQLPSSIRRPEKAAIKELLRLADTVSGRDVWITVMAMYLLQADDPRLIKNETAFRTQMVRRIRGLSSSSYSHWQGAADGRERRAIRELEPRTVAYLSTMLVELFGTAGVKLTQIERREEEEQRKERLASYDALAEME